jgi:hypothetical protein
VIVDLFFLTAVAGMPRFACIHVHCRPKSTIDNTIHIGFGLAGGLNLGPTITQDLGLDLQEISLNGGGSADAPHQGCKSEHELTFDGRLSIVISYDGCFERLIVSNIFQSDDHSFSCQSMPDRVVPRSSFAIFSFRAGAADCVASIGFNLSKRSHLLVSPSVFWETRLSGSAAGKQLTTLF